MTESTSTTPVSGVDDDADVYENVVVGATPNPLMPRPDATDELFADGANRALQDSVELLRRLIPSHQAAAAIIVDGDWTSLRKYFSLSPKYGKWSRYHTPAQGFGIHRWLMQQQQPVRLTQAELENHPAWIGFGREASAHPPMRGWLAAPLRDSANVCWGLLQLSDRQNGDYTLADEAALARYCDLLSLTLETLWDVRNLRKQLQLGAGLPEAAAHGGQVPGQQI